jgi:DNA-binding winged helix-turn-helix (wHTH) protein/Tfp pilus assembly protein PilF
MIIKLEQWFLNTVTGSIYLDECCPENNTITLDHTPLELLLCLIRHQGDDVSKDTMLNEVWPNKVVSEDVLSVGISQIRKALGDNARKPNFIKTIPGIGYRLIIKVEEKNTVKNAQEEKITLPSLFKKNKNIINLSVLFLNVLFALLLGYFYSESNTQITLDDFPSQGAIDHYQEARYLLEQEDKEGWKRAEQAIEDTLIKVPNYAPAYRDLVNAKLKNIGFNNGVESLKHLDEYYFLLNKSLSFSPNNVETHLLMADVAFMVEWNFELANIHFKKAVELDPQNSLAHFKYSEFLLAAEKFDLAIKHIQAYVALEPSGYAVPSVAWIYNMMENFPSAKKELDKLRKLDPDSFGYHISAQAILENSGDDDASFKELYEILVLSKYTQKQLTDVNSAFILGGLPAVNLWLLEEKKEPAYIGQYEPPLSFARYAIKAGKHELAVDYIKQALAERNPILLWFNVDPKYKPIRNHPELKNMINPHKTAQ